ncbi:hypothetical protein ACFPVX_04365 [Cohnella faecalis]|uniref:hypothetical protein n=1 Tax=Cohnella faecalis TaxID=2315694 RepID=UPI0036222FDC
MQQPKARMTFRFDNVNKATQPSQPQTPSHQEPRPTKEQTETDEFLPDSSTAVSKSDTDEIAALEELIRQSQPVPYPIKKTKINAAAEIENNPAEGKEKADSMPVRHSWGNGADHALNRSVTVLIDDGIMMDYPDHETGPRLYSIDSTTATGDEHRLTKTRAEDDAKRTVSWLGGAALRSDGPSWWRVFVSVAGAIVTGALFGYLVLSLFTGEPLFSGKTADSSGEQASTAAVVSAQTLPSVSSKPEGADSVKGGSNGQAVETTIAGEAYYMLQYGVFRTSESRDTALGQLKELGLPAAASTDSQAGLHVYAGIALTKDDAEQASGALSGVELYVKRIDTEPLTLSRGTDSDSWAAFLNSSAALEKKLAQLTVVSMQSDSLTAVAAKDQDELQAAHDKLATDWNAVKKLEGKAKEHADFIVAQLGIAVRELAEYNEKPAKNKVREVQSALMQAVIADVELRQSLQSSKVG